LLVAEGVLEPGRTVMLDPVEGRHAVGPLRLRPGDHVVVADGAGVVAHGHLQPAGRGGVGVAVETVARVGPPTGGLVLAVAVLAGPAMDLVVHKAVELDVARLVPVCTARTQAGVRAAAQRGTHWRKVARQALKQCRREWAMEISAPMALVDLIEDPEFGATGVVAHREGGTVEELPAGRGRLLLVGPEGGFSSDEERQLDASGWPRVGLGRLVLRAETAAIVGVARLTDRFGAGGS
jgi:16S rRNA (uracil1498-N3)-methyltransferase